MKKVSLSLIVDGEEKTSIEGFIRDSEANLKETSDELKKITWMTMHKDKSLISEEYNEFIKTASKDYPNKLYKIIVDVSEDKQEGGR